MNPAWSAQFFLQYKVYLCQIQNCDKYMRVYKCTPYVHLNQDLLMTTPKIAAM